MVSVAFGPIDNPDQTGDVDVPPGLAAATPLMTVDPVLYVKPVGRLSVTETLVAVVLGSGFWTVIE